MVDAPQPKAPTSQAPSLFPSEGERTEESGAHENTGPFYARVIVDIDAPHLDTPFDYSVPEDMRDRIRVGSLVKVRFGRRRVSGYVASLTNTTEYSGRLNPVLTLVTPLPVISPALLASARYLAVRYCASTSQILSFVVPPRRASVETSLATRIEEARVAKTGIFADTNEAHKNSTDTLPLRRILTCLPQTDDTVIAALVREQHDLGRTVIVLAPTAAAAQERADALREATHLRVGHIDADHTPHRRYRTYLLALLGDYDVLVGTRSAVWTPMPHLGAIIVWDDGDDRYRELRAPRFDALDITVARSHMEGISFALPAYARSLKAQALVETRWASEEIPTRAQALALIPRLRSFDEFSAEREGVSGRTRLPDAAYRLIREALPVGPVLIHVPAAGHTVLDGERIRVGSDRIAEEIGRAFPDVDTVVSSSTAGVHRSLPASSQIVVATSGAEPYVEGGYSAILITGASALAYRNTLDATLEAQRRWMNALALAAPQAPAMLIGAVPPDLLDALLLWEPRRLAHDIWDQHRHLGFPPARWVVAIEGPTPSVAAEKRAAEAVLGSAAPSLLETDPSPLTLVTSGSLPSEDSTPHTRLVLSVAPRNVHQLMSALGEARRDLSRANRPLPRFDINPPTLVAVEG